MYLNFNIAMNETKIAVAITEECKLVFQPLNFAKLVTDVFAVIERNSVMEYI